jgi:hypothetical protein
MSSVFGPCLAKRDLTGIEKEMTLRFGPKVKDRSMFSSGFALLDNKGVSITGRQLLQHSSAQNYSNYSPIEKALKNHKTTQTVMFIQDKPKIYIICSPVINNQKVQGIMILGYNFQELEKRQLTEEEFLSMDLNK